MRRTALALLAVALTAAGCGGSSNKSSSSSAAATTAAASSTSVADVLSGIKTQTGPQKVDATVSVKLDGTPASLGAAGALLSGPIKVTISGVEDTTTKAAVVTLGVNAGPLNLNMRLMTDGKKSWLQYNNDWYTLDASALSGITGTTATAPTTTTSPMDVTKLESALSNPAKFFKTSSVVGDESVGGITCTHVTGTVDIAAVLAAVQQSGVTSGATGSGLNSLSGGALSAQNMQQLEQAFTNATIDVWVGKDDHIVHRITANVAIDATKLPQSSSTSGLKGMAVNLDATILPATAPTITPPANPKPSSMLGQALLGSLGPALGGSTGLPTTTG
jgi:hypothetical protein